MSDEPVPKDHTWWQSSRVGLVLLGAVGISGLGLSGCTRQETFRRNIYATPEDCKSDYSSIICTATGTFDKDRFLGPTYRLVNGRPSACTSADPGPGRIGLGLMRKSLGTTNVARGGFGLSCSTGGSSGGGRTWGWG